MIATNRFDPVFDCQKVFKSLMNAMARPGTAFSIAESVDKLNTPKAHVVATARTLLDNHCRFFVWNDAVLTEEIRELTYAEPASPEEADYLFVPRAADAADAVALLSRAKTGTLTQPHRSATLFVAQEQLAGDEEVVLSGPGVNGEIALSLPASGMAWLRARQDANVELPCGVELYFVTPDGQIVCVPRKTNVEEA